MLLEFDADQKLWQDTVRDAVAKQCPPALVRSVAEQDIDPTPQWKAYVDAGWTEMNDPSSAVELAIVVEELGRATDPTPFLARMTHFAPLATDRFDPHDSGTAVFGGVFLFGAGEASARRAGVFDPVLHIAEVSFAGLKVPESARLGDADPERSRHVALTGMALTIVGACQRILDLVLEHVRERHQFGVPIGSFQAIQHKAADMHVAIERARALAYFAALTIAEDDPRRRLAAAMAKAAAGG